jgi:DNA repair protein RadC
VAFVDDKYTKGGRTVSKVNQNCLGHRQRLRDRFLKVGLEGLADYEVVELLLTLAIPRSDVKQPAKALIARFGNLRGILDASLEDLQEIKGIGSVAPVAFKIIRVAAALYLQQSVEGAELLSDFDRLSAFWRLRIGALRDEVFEVAYLDSGFRLQRDGVERLEEGTIDRATVYPRRVVEAALRRGAAALVLAHNHPNDDVKPSEQDKLLTRAIVLAAETVSLKIMDHLIVSPDEVFSFRKAGLI